MKDFIEGKGIELIIDPEIEEKYHESIFNRFDQAYDKISEEHGGSGLGLTLTKQLVNLHNGHISVKKHPWRRK